MKSLLFFKLLFIPYMMMAATAASDWKKEYSPILSRIDDHSIKASFNSVGGYSGECVSLDMQNLTNKEQKIVMEAGDKLMCENEEMQNIFITQTQYIVLAPHATKRNSVFGFCCAHDKSAPSKEVAFRYTDDTLTKELKLANYLNTHRLLDLSAVQHAVWVVCNDANIDGIYAEDMASIQELKKVVADITGKEIPWYTKKYDIDSLGRLQETSSKLIAIMDFNLAKESEVTVQITNAQQVVLKVPMQERLLQRGHYDYQFTWETNRLPKGTYLARVFCDGQMIQEKTIML